MRKTTFVQNLSKTDLFGDLKENFWISKIPRSSEREKHKKSCFKKHVNFKCPHSLEDFSMELFSEKKRR